MATRSKGSSNPSEPALAAITDRLADRLDGLAFAPPVAYVYNPLRYARAGWSAYCRLYGEARREILLVGMNPGPWGMAQTGVPFGEISLVRDWLAIETAIGQPARTHPKKPVHGFACRRSEVSGKRLWGWARDRFTTPDRFFARFFVANYCPLLFLDGDGRNLTPNVLAATERRRLQEHCDEALRRTAAHFRPRLVVGVGRFAADRVTEALAGMEIATGMITHPSPANPKANRGWEKLIESEFTALGVAIDAGG